MSTIPLISHRLYVEAVRPDSKAEAESNLSRPVPPHPWGEGEPNPGTRRDGAVPVKVAGDWKVRARSDESADQNPAPEAPEIPLEILENRRPMPSGARRLQSTMRTTL